MVLARPFTPAPTIANLARGLLALAALALATAGAAQGFDGSQVVDAYAGPAIAGGRILGLGGAYVGVGEGLGGAPVNPASVGQRDRHLDDTWSLDGVLTWYVPDLGAVARQDVGNDGAADSGLSGVANAQVGAMGQTGRLGVGIVARAWEVSAPRAPFASMSVGTLDTAVSVGWSTLRDSLVVGASLTSFNATSTVTPSDGGEPVTLVYQGPALRLGALVRPRGRPYRLGAAFDPGGRARPRGDRALFPVTTPTAVVFPWTLALGASAWLGPNAARYNEPAPIARAQHPEWGPGPGWEPTRRRPVLVSAQIDVIGPVAHAVSLESVLLDGAPARESGRRPSLALHAGAEWEGWPDVLRVRGGAYLEPSRSGASRRAHATFGAEVRVPCWPWDLQLSVAGDLARMYRNVSLSVGFWSDLGPSRPSAAELEAELEAGRSDGLR